MTAFARCFSSLLIGFVFSATAIAATAPAYFVDGDGDAVPDEIDDCPYTHPGVRVGPKGCPLRSDDSDLDGVTDEDDDCPYSPAGAVIDAHGCSLDSDFDGVANGIDRCPRTGLALTVDAKGCAEGERAEPATAVPSAAPGAKRSARSTPRKVVTPPVLEPLPAPEISPAASEPVAPLVKSKADPSEASPAVMTAPQSSAPGPSAPVESPEMLLSFGTNSSRLGTRDAAVIEGYARIFARRLAEKPGSKLHIRAFADRREGDAAVLAVARMVVVRSALVAQGISIDRIHSENSVLDGGNPRQNRRVEASLDD